MMKIMFSLISFLGVGLMQKFSLSYWILIDLLIIVMFIMLFTYPVYESDLMMSEWFILDVMSVGLISLSVLLVVIMLFSSVLIVNMSIYSNVYLVFMLVLLISLIMGFLMNNYLVFYVLFEISLIPTLFIIMGWGYQPERLQAGIYFMMYTLSASLPLLLGLVYLNSNSVSMSMWDSLLSFNEELDFSLFNSILGLVLVLAFLVKLPLFLFHLWLPSAHVEAPVAGSMILAGVLLKLGGYGLIRVMNKLAIYVNYLSMILVVLSLVGMILVGLVCCRLNDLKALVAYSSVAHMGLVVSGIMTMGVWGINGGLMMMISHGVASSGLFCFVNMVYERVGSRSMFLNKGVVSILPIFSLLLFLLCCSNISAPPSINLLSEIPLIISIYGFDQFTMLLFPLGSFLGAAFTLYMYSFSQHGKFFFGSLSVVNSLYLEYHSLILHVLPINLLILKNDWLMNFF